MQIERVQAELGDAQIPALVPVPGTSRKVLVTHLVALTGTRFANALTLSAARSAHVQPPSPGNDTAAPDAEAPSASTQQSRAHEDQAPEREELMDAAVAAAAATSTDNDAAALSHVVDIVEGAAPERLSLAEALALAQAASFCMADAVLQQLPAYLAPLFAAAPYVEVRCSVYPDAPDS